MAVTGILIGAGERGKMYAEYAKECCEAFQIVGVAEPRQSARTYIKNKFNLKDERCFQDWSALCKAEKFADCVLICTQDQDHVRAVSAMALKGYHILVEKPMAVSKEDCRTIYSICRENNLILAVCHVLRYHPSVKKLKELIDSGIIGNVVNISHTEPIGFWHFAHSFVRGNWGNTSRSTFSLLSKCCHDVDLICYWMSDKKCTKVSSFGSLHHFRKENKPEGAGSRCLECGVEAECPYSAKKIYLDPKPNCPVFPMSVVCDLHGTSEEYLYHLTEAIKTGAYGKCVYDTDNDVCDNQIVNFQFEDGSTASLTMIAFTKEICERNTTVYGTKGVLKWNDFYDYKVDYYDFLSNQSRTILCEDAKPGNKWGHGGSDFFTIHSFVEAVASNNIDLVATGPKVSLLSHLLTFAAEESRLKGTVILPQEDKKWIIED